MKSKWTLARSDASLLLQGPHLFRRKIACLGSSVVSLPAADGAPRCRAEDTISLPGQVAEADEPLLDPRSLDQRQAQQVLVRCRCSIACGLRAAAIGYRTHLAPSRDAKMPSAVGTCRNFCGRCAWSALQVGIGFSSA